MRVNIYFYYHSYMSGDKNHDKKTQEKTFTMHVAHLK